jgi:hypothetical protein
MASKVKSDWKMQIFIQFLSGLITETITLDSLEFLNIFKTLLKHTFFINLYSQRENRSQN